MKKLFSFGQPSLRRMFFRLILAAGFLLLGLQLAALLQIDIGRVKLLFVLACAPAIGLVIVETVVARGISKPSVPASVLEKLSDSDLSEYLNRAYSTTPPPTLIDVYKEELDSREQNRRHQKEDRRENLIVALITLELVVGVVTLGWTVKEFRDQTDHQDKQFSQQMAKQGEQIALLKDLEKSLDVLRSGEIKREIEAQFMPDIYISDGRVPRGLSKTNRGRPFEGGRRIDFILGNTGPANATGIRVILSATRSISEIVCNDKGFRVEAMPIGEVEQISVRKKIIIPEILAKVTGRIGLPLTFIGGSAQQPTGDVSFEVITDQHPEPVSLGSTTISLFL